MTSIRSRAEIQAYFPFKAQPTATQFAETWESTAFRQGTPHAIAQGLLFDLGSGTEVVAALCPADNRMLFSHAVFRDISAAAAAARVEIYTAASGDIIPTVDFTNLTTGKAMIARPSVQPAVFQGTIIAGGSIKLKTTTTVASRTCRVDIFAYLMPASD